MLPRPRALALVLLGMAATLQMACRGDAPPEPQAQTAVPATPVALATAPLPEGTVSVKLLYSNNVDGDTEPCG